jgi:hypothetical protein
MVDARTTENAMMRTTVQYVETAVQVEREVDDAILVEPPVQAENEGDQAVHVEQQ